MDPLTGYLILFALGFMLRSAVGHARSDYQRTREAELKAATVKAGKPPTPAVRNKLRRQHRAGWWASEIGRGFPVTRTGLHTGWLAHQAAAMHTRAQREAARTTHLNAAASFAEAVRDHRKWQEAARADIEAALAKSPVRLDGSAKAVREAAGDAVVLPFRKPKCQGCGKPAVPVIRHLPGQTEPGFWCTGCAAVPCPDPVCADEPAEPERGPYAARDDTRPDDSAGLRPGEPRCEACGGTGGNGSGAPGIAGACMVCRGWGSAAPDPATMAPAPEGAVCAACGRPGTEDDPVRTDPAGQAIHRSHAAKAHERYQEAMTTMRVTTPDATEGAPPMSGDTTYNSVLTACKAAVAQSDQDTSTIRGRKDAAYRLADEMIAANVDPAVVSAQMSYADSLAEAEKHLAAAGEHATSTSSTAQRYHGAMQEATDNSPGKIAERSFHDGG